MCNSIKKRKLRMCRMKQNDNSETNEINEMHLEQLSRYVSECDNMEDNEHCANLNSWNSSKEKYIFRKYLFVFLFGILLFLKSVFHKLGLSSISYRLDISIFHDVILKDRIKQRPVTSDFSLQEVNIENIIKTTVYCLHTSVSISFLLKQGMNPYINFKILFRSWFWIKTY